MKLNKKIIKKNKKNKKKQKKVAKNNIETVSEKISFILDRADSKLIKNITTILGPKLALRICNQTSDVEEAGGINDPQLPSKRFSKLESFLHLIENDSSISENKKNSIKDQKTSTSLAPVTPKIDKRKHKKLKQKVKGIQGELDKLCLNQIRNEAKNPASSNYFAIQNISKLDDVCSTKLASLIKPSKFNLNLSNGVPSIQPNYSNSLINRPRLDLNQIGFESNGALGGSMQNFSVFGNLQSTNSPFSNSAANSINSDTRHGSLAFAEVATTNLSTVLARNESHPAATNQYNQTNLPSSSNNGTASASSTSPTSSNNVASLFALGGNPLN